MSLSVSRELNISQACVDSVDYFLGVDVLVMLRAYTGRHLYLALLKLLFFSVAINASHLQRTSLRLIFSMVH